MEEEERPTEKVLWEPRCESLKGCGSSPRGMPGRGFYRIVFPGGSNPLNGGLETSFIAERAAVQQQGGWCYPKASCPNKTVFADLDKIIKTENLFLVCGFFWRELGL